MYKLIHINEDNLDEKDIGTYDSMEIIEDTIKLYSTEIMGFKDYPNGFRVYEIPVMDERKSDDGILYEVTSFYWNEEEYDCDEVVYHCVFWNKKNAEQYVKENKEKLSKNGKSVSIQKAWLNRNEWSEGFVDFKAEIYKLLDMYNQGQYTTSLFCELFSEMYYFEAGGYKLFKGAERQILDELAEVVERYTTCDEDVKNFPNTYVDEHKVRKTFEKAYKLLEEIDNVEVVD